VLGCRYVDDVLLDAPWQVTPEMIATLRLLERHLQVFGVLDAGTVDNPK